MDEEKKDLGSILGNEFVNITPNNPGNRIDQMRGEYNGKFAIIADVHGAEHYPNRNFKDYDEATFYGFNSLYFGIIKSMEGEMYSLINPSDGSEKQLFYSDIVSLFILNEEGTENK